MIQLDTITQALQPALKVIRDRISGLSERKPSATATPTAERRTFGNWFDDDAKQQAEELVRTILDQFKSSGMVTGPLLILILARICRLTSILPSLFAIAKMDDAHNLDPLTLLAKVSHLEGGNAKIWSEDVANNHPNFPIKETRERLLTLIVDCLTVILHIRVS